MSRAESDVVSSWAGWLLALPLAVYGLSYVYLSVYHGTAWLFPVVIHEGGTYTLLQTIFYASHFLGHVPSLTVISLLFAGTVQLLCGAPLAGNRSRAALAAAVGLLLIGSTILALTHYGVEDTLDFILQRKQGVGVYAAGGSWNLHLPSTMLLFTVAPVYVYFAGWILRLPLHNRRGALRLYAVAAVLVVLLTVLFNSNPAHAFAVAWTDPRYLAHSIRELATFAVTFFPLPLYVLWRRAQPGASFVQSPPRWILILAIVSFVAIVYQSVVPLTAGIGNLAQKPAFAAGGTLSIPYLLAAHYFEHVLDTIYFTLLTLLLFSPRLRRTIPISPRRVS